MWQAELPSPEEDEAIMSIIFVSSLYALLLSGIFLLPNHFPLMHAFALEIRKGFLSREKQQQRNDESRRRRRSSMELFKKYILHHLISKNKEQSLFVRRMTVITDC